MNLNDPTLSILSQFKKYKGQFYLNGVEGSALAFALARIWLNQPLFWLIVCPTMFLAETIARDLEFFLINKTKDKQQSPVRFFPEYNFSSYQFIEPYSKVRAQRIAILWELVCAEEPLILVTSARGLANRLCPPEYLVDQALIIQAGRPLDRNVLLETLIQGGYSSASLVKQIGEFAVRGSVIDFFGPLLDQPIRVEFSNNYVESLRSFNPIDQRSQITMSLTTLIPYYEIDFSLKAVTQAIKSLCKLVNAESLSSHQLNETIKLMNLRVPFKGSEFFLPLYHAKVVDLFNYLPSQTLYTLVEPTEIKAQLMINAKMMADEFEKISKNGQLVLSPLRLQYTPDQIIHRLKKQFYLICKKLSIFSSDEKNSFVNQEVNTLSINLKASTHTNLHQELLHKGEESSLLASFLAWVNKYRHKRHNIILVCRSQTQIERLSKLFATRKVQALTNKQVIDIINLESSGQLYIVVGELSTGFIPSELPLAIVTEDEVFGAPRIIIQKNISHRLSEITNTFNELMPGDLVVHIDHGIARYDGLLSLAVGSAESDFLLLSYQGGDKLYLPADRIGLISKYRGLNENQPLLDRIGSKTWNRTKAKVKKAVEAIARDLLELYATRSIQNGHAFNMPDIAFREFEATFPYEETLDQIKAIKDVLADLTAPRPMDRLICGDVGYGKTEVALRAAYLVATQGKQVAMLVPTTVLAEQHYQTFILRLSEQSLVVESLSRFKSIAKQKKILEDLAIGRIDIIIGTHRLLQKDVIFKNIGLLIVDEEHRFGVKNKEYFKKMRNLVDVLTLSATPIPRTLQMSLLGIRDLSVINTPPPDRQAIKTYLMSFSHKALCEAIERELARGGQIFFVHNRVQGIEKIAHLIKKLVPYAKVGIGHGQLSGKALEKIMLAFVRRELNVLVCTTIIESGLDISNANTIIIDQVEKLGLSQIYQLRGRVGRADQTAYAYLFIRDKKFLSSDAINRLKALMDFTHLGDGFAIAMHDLEIRGAGNLLGEVQSGQIATVGYDFYIRMLEEAITKLKGEIPVDRPEIELHLGIKAFLPESYIQDARMRLNFYKRLSLVRSINDLVAVEAEMKDLFGTLPEVASNLFDVVGIKSCLRQLWVTRLDLDAQEIQIHFFHQSKLDMDKLLRVARHNFHEVKVCSDGKVLLKIKKTGISPWPKAIVSRLYKWFSDILY